MRRTVQRRAVSSLGQDGMVDINKVDFGTMRVEATDRSATIELLAKEQQRWFRENKPAYFKDTEIENPETIKEWLASKMVKFDFSRGRLQSNASGQRIAITMLNHVNNPDWATLFGIKEMYLDVTMWLFTIHMWLVQKRMWVIPEAAQINKAMMTTFTNTAKLRLTNMVHTSMQQQHELDKYYGMYNKNNLALDESFHSECSYRDAMLMYALFRNSPFEHRDEVPFYAWFTLVQYIRLQLAVLDRMPNHEVKQGLFYFYHPLDGDLFDHPSKLDSARYVADLMQGRKGGIQPPKKETKSDTTNDASSA